MKTLRNTPEIIVRNGKPAAVILKIEDYEELLERLEDAADLKWLREVRRKGPSFRKFEEFLAAAGAHV